MSPTLNTLKLKKKTLHLIECVPNFSEGRNPSVIEAIANAIRSVRRVKLLHIDVGYAANRTVFTFVGTPAAVVQAAFAAIKVASELIDMRQHKGEHPRIGATDVCPFVPIGKMNLAEAAMWSQDLAKMVSEKLNIPVYLYAYATYNPNRKNLEHIRAGEYEGLEEKMKKPDWKSSYNETPFNPKSGATVIGARPFLIAYNVNLDTKDVKIAKAIAADVRESGRKIKDANGDIQQQKGALKAVKAIGWFIEEYGVAQVSMNLTDMSKTPLHVAFETVCQATEKYGVRVTGSELIGLIPQRALTDAGSYFLEKKGQNTEIEEAELMEIAIKTMGLDALKPFNPNERVIEIMLENNMP